MYRGLSLCSGGLDSSLVLLRLLEQGNSVTPVYVDYGHWATRGELPVLREFLGWAKATQLFHANLDDLVVIKADLGLSIGGVWGRSIAVVGLAAMWAFTHGNNYDFIATGSHKGDVCPDCKPGLFDTRLGEALVLATEGKLNLDLPIRDYTISEIGEQLFRGFNVPPDLTYSCYWYPPCGYKSESEAYRCPGCRRKVLAMSAAGIRDTEFLDLPNCRARSYYPADAERPGY